MKRSYLDIWVKEIENLTKLEREDIEKLQLDRLNTLLEKEKRRGGFYGRLPSSLTSLADLAALPFTSASDLMAYGGSMMLVSQSDVQRVLTSTTSGTTGEAKRVFYTPKDCANTIAFFAAGLSEMVSHGSRTMICMPFSGPFGLGELICAAIESLGAMPIQAGVSRTYGELCDILRDEKPDTYVGMPAHLLAMLKYCGKGPLQRALVSGDACVTPVLDTIEKRLGTKLFPHYGSREMGLGGAVTCPAHEGMHLRENHVIAEIVDGNGNVLPDGEYGELVITTIGMEAMPLIRYRTGDYTRKLKVPCLCKSWLTRIDSIERKGASSDILALDKALLGLDNVVDFKAVQKDDTVVIEALTLWKTQGRCLEEAVRSALPGIKVRATERLCEKSDVPLYAGKRKIIEA